MNIATITAAAAPATRPAQTPAASVVAVITQMAGLTGLFPGRRSCARAAGSAGRASSDPVGMPAVTAASSALVRPRSADPARTRP